MAYVHLLLSFSLKIEEGKLHSLKHLFAVFIQKNVQSKDGIRKRKMDFLRRKVYGIQTGCKSMNG